MEEKYSYNYSADSNEELRNIRAKYQIKNDEEQDKLENERNILFPLSKIYRCGFIK